MTIGRLGIDACLRCHALVPVPRAKCCPCCCVLLQWHDWGWPGVPPVLVGARSWLGGPPVRDRLTTATRAEADAFAKRAFGERGQAVRDGVYHKIGWRLPPVKGAKATGTPPRLSGGGARTRNGPSFVEEGRGLTWAAAIQDAKPISRHVTETPNGPMYHYNLVSAYPLSTLAGALNSEITREAARR